MPRLTLDTNICIHAIKRNKSESFAASKGLGRPWLVLAEMGGRMHT